MMNWMLNEKAIRATLHSYKNKVQKWSNPPNSLSTCTKIRIEKESTKLLEEPIRLLMKLDSSIASDSPTPKMIPLMNMLPP
jgi:hypothetical protein